MKKGRVASVAVAVGLTLAGMSLAKGASPCARYSLTAPVVGTKAGSQCSPVPLPTPFDTAIIHDECGGVPPAGTTICWGGTVYIVTP